MPNLYATPAEIKSALPNAIRSTTTTYDAEFMRLADEVSRYIDNYCGRVFYPTLATDYFSPRKAGATLRIGDWVSITSVSMSADDGQTYTLLAATDWYASVEEDVNSKKSYTHIHIDVNGAYTYFYTGQKSIKVVGVRGYCDDRDTCFEDSLDEVESNPLAAADTTCTVNDHDGVDLWGFIPRFAAGQLVRVESEYAEVTAAAANALTLARGRNGTAAASHAQNTQIDIWRPPAPVKRAVIVQLVRAFERALQGYGDGRALPEMSQIVWTRALDPDTVANLAPYAIPVHA